MLDRERYFEFRFLRPNFAARRLMSLPVFDARKYADANLSPQEAAHLRTVSLEAGKTFPRRKLLFVFGCMPRSGTNFLFEMLLCHPRFARSAIPLDEFGVLASPEAFDAPRNTIGRLHPPSAAAFARMEWMAFALAGFRNRLLSLAADDTVTVIKEPHAYHIELLPVLFQQDRCIVLLRNARYIVDSYFRTFVRRRFGRSFEEVCMETAAALTKVLDFLEAAPSGYAYMVRYEDAALHRARVMGEILCWMGEDVREEDMAALGRIPVLGSSTHSRGADGQVQWTPQVPGTDFDPTCRPLDWSRSQELTFERVCAAVNRRAGYGP